MIVKKMPILQGFPDFKTVKFFTGKFFQKYNFTPVFYDIETTGLSRNSTYLYLIGAVGIEDETWNFYQWMAENASEEETILRIFSQFLQQCDLLISYNGERFDQPYLEARYEKYGIPSPFTGKQSLDLYLTLKPLKSLLKLSAMKQPCMEEFLGIKDRIYDNGKECIKLYKDFLKKRDAFTADEILGHNLEDVLGLGRIFDMLGYLCIYDGDYEVTYSEFDGDNLILKLKLPCTLPQEFSNGNTDFYLTGKDEKKIKIYRWLYILAVFIGPYMTVAAVWTIADIFNGLMALPNMIALFALSGVVVKETKRFFDVYADQKMAKKKSSVSIKDAAKN